MKNKKEKQIEKTLKLLDLFIDKNDGEQVESLATSLIWDLSRFEKWETLVKYLNVVVNFAKNLKNVKK